MDTGSASEYWDIQAAEFDDQPDHGLQDRPSVTLGLTDPGKTLLAGLTETEVRRRLEGVALQPMTEYTIADPDELVRELQRIRQNGYGEDREEYVVGCRCVAMPVHGRDGRPIAAMSVSVPTPRFTPRLERTIHEELARTVRELEELLQDK